MNTEEHRRWREMLGAYALGHLEVEERAEIDAHLEGCAECRAEVEDFREVVEALSLAKPDFDESQTPPDDLMDRTLSRVHDEEERESSRRFRRNVGIGLTAAAAVVIVVFAGIFGSSLLAPGPPQEEVAITDEQAGVDAEARLIAHTWGTETLMTVQGLEAGENYTLTINRKDGTAVPSGTILGTGDNTIECEMNAAVLRENADGLEVRGEDGELVFAADFPEVSGVTPQA